MPDTPAPDAALRGDRPDVVRYSDGGRWLFADMPAVYRRLHAATDYQLQAVQDAARGEDKAAAAEAVGRLLAGVRQAFDLPPFDPATGAGATDQHVLDAYEVLLSWLRTRKEESGARPATA